MGHSLVFCLLFKGHQAPNEPIPENSLHLASLQSLKICIKVHQQDRPAAASLL